MRELNEVVDRIIASISDHPDDWEFSHYEATHKSGLIVWIANHHYGLAIKVPDGRYSTRDFGGVSTASTFFGPLIPWRRRLLRACRDEAARRAPEPVLTVALKMLAAA